MCENCAEAVHDGNKLFQADDYEEGIHASCTLLCVCVFFLRDQFIEDNLLFYTVLFQEFLPRVYRMDLTSPQSAYMLFRVTKVLLTANVLCHATLNSVLSY